MAQKSIGLATLNHSALNVVLIRLSADKSIVRYCISSIRYYFSDSTPVDFLISCTLHTYEKPSTRQPKV